MAIHKTRAVIHHAGRLSTANPQVSPQRCAPWLLRQRVRLTRYPAGVALEELVDRFWAVRWDLPPGLVHRQQVLTHPGANFVIGHPNGRASDSQAGRIEALLNGVARGLTTRVLVRRGWAAAALTAWSGPR